MGRGQKDHTHHYPQPTRYSIKHLPKSSNCMDNFATNIGSTTPSNAASPMPQWKCEVLKYDQNAMVQVTLGPVLGSLTCLQEQHHSLSKSSAGFNLRLTRLLRASSKVCLITSAKDRALAMGRTASGTHLIYTRRTCAQMECEAEGVFGMSAWRMCTPLLVAAQPCVVLQDVIC